MTLRAMLLVALCIGIVPAVVGTVARNLWISRKIEAARGYGSGSPFFASPPLAHDCNPVLLVLGDSRMAQWTSDDQTTFWQIVNRSRGGETAQQLSHRFVAELEHARSKTVVLSIGINDVVGISFMQPGDAEVAIDNFAGAYLRMANWALSQHFTLLVTTIIPPSRPSLLRSLVWSPRTIDILQAANQRLRTLHWPANTTLLDLAAFYSSDERGYLDPKYRKDTLHFNTSAYAILQNALFAAPALQKPQPLKPTPSCVQ